MLTAAELLRQGRTEDLWQKCCGYLDLSIEEFMNIQRRLLLEQLERLKRCELGEKIFQGAQPRTVEEFREQVPFTTYADYFPYLPEKIEDALPEKPMTWTHTSGKSGAYTFKWSPFTKRMCQELETTILGVVLLSMCKGRGDITIKEYDKMLYAFAPPPYITGTIIHGVHNVFPIDFLPPLDESD